MDQSAFLVLVTFGRHGPKSRSHYIVVGLALHLSYVSLAFSRVSLTITQD